MACYRDSFTLPYLLYGAKTWLLIYREELVPMVFEDKVLKGICRPKKDELKRSWRKVLSEKHYKLYCAQIE
jgi:hypothetical protein